MADQQGAQASTWRGGGRGWRGGRGRGGRGGSGGARPRPPPPPDHFISLRMPSELAAPFFDAAHAALRGYAGGVLEPYLVGRKTAHVTLAVVRLNCESSEKGGVPFGAEAERKAAGSAAAAAGSAAAPEPASRGVAPWAQRRRDPLKVEAATRALAAAAESISAASLLQEERSEAEAEGNEDEPAKTTTTATAATTAKTTTTTTTTATPVASALLSGLRIEPELGTFGRGRVLWLRLDDGVGGRALAAAERAVTRALEAEAAVLLGAESGGGQSPLPPPPQPPKPPQPPAKDFTPHITVAKVPWIPQAGRRSAPPRAGAADSSPSSSARPPPPSRIPQEAHEGALAGLARSAPFGASELELCRMGSSAGGQYYEVVATAKISVAAAKEEEEEQEGGGG